MLAAEAEESKVGRYRKACMQGSSFAPKDTNLSRQAAAFKILDGCERIMNLITHATSNTLHGRFGAPLSPLSMTASNFNSAHDPEQLLKTQQQLERAALLMYTDDEKAERKACGEGIKTSIRALEKTRQFQMVELKRLSNRFVMQARHANSVIAMANGGNEEEQAEKVFSYQLKHSQFAALASLGSHQICRFKVFAAFQNKVEIEKKTLKLRLQKLKFSKMKQSSNVVDGQDDEAAKQREREKFEEFKKLKSELEALKMKEKQQDHH
jgi:hypothetical protein